MCIKSSFKFLLKKTSQYSESHKILLFNFSQWKVFMVVKLFDGLVLGTSFQNVFVVYILIMIA